MADKFPAFMNRPGEVRRRDIAARLGGEKVSKELANYRVGNDTQGGKVCFECIHYLDVGMEVSECRRVSGPVEARDTCDLFAPRTSN